ncbi:integral membrane sensor signal transduction histidine kinase [Indibacter alkaliphilus LW1]|uniref:histidine kinase n=1 Tax=Indibacter alkaliphilus (strain CCUG 57479 / KCTC 22604 / LW1) TaxID=1189612 RepID=S2DI90_INDAL|nr:ATP-binding protein [Indibacter alkaliphilus]EOZ98729.1 integral membrane sensor signal transduction histidine kinase [Indibacter alkaliphilus LW1]
MESKLFKIENYGFFNNAPFEFLSLNKMGEITHANQTVCDWIEHKQEELIDNFTFQDLLSVGGKIYLETHFFPLIQLQGKISEISFELVSKSKRRIPVLVNGTKFSIEDKGEQGYLIFLTDISQRKQYEEELLMAKRFAEENASKLFDKNNELERFTQIASHDLKAPVRTMGGLFELMVKKNYVSKDQDSIKIQKMIMENLKRMRVLVDDLMEQTLVDTESYFEEKVDLNFILNDVKEVLMADILFNAVSIQSEKLPIVRGNKNQIFRLFQNLLSNSIKFKDKNRRPLIQIRSKLENNWAMLSIKDNGIGFDPLYKEKIFGYMQRLHGQEVVSGSGLGLYACKKIIEHHGGKINGNSNVGEGAEFVFTLPLYNN